MSRFIFIDYINGILDIQNDVFCCIIIYSFECIVYNIIIYSSECIVYIFTFLNHYLIEKIRRPVATVGCLQNKRILFSWILV